MINKAPRWLVRQMSVECGQVRKMAAKLSVPVEYSFVLGDKKISVNPLLGKELSLRFTGNINCVACGRSIKKTFNQGYCFPCMRTLASCDMCILKPENCHYHLGTCREPSWGENNCFIPHYVYLANSSGLKVGLTKENQIPIRWIDQGATQGLIIMKVASRYQAGLIEAKFAEKISDKTNWRKMLTNHPDQIDLESARDKLFSELAVDIQNIASQFDFGDIEMLTTEKSLDIKFPVLQYPKKINSYNLDKTPEFTDILQGIKGQYLIFENGVINLRKYTAYELEIKYYT